MSLDATVRARIDVDLKKDVEKITNIGTVEGFECPKCGAEMV